MEHVDIPAGERHAPHQWVVADEAARLALVPAAGDIGAYCWQQSDNTEWMLTDHTPVVWAERGRNGSDATVTVPAITSALGYTPASTEAVADVLAAAELAQSTADAAGAAATSAQGTADAAGAAATSAQGTAVAAGEAADLAQAAANAAAAAADDLEARQADTSSAANGAGLSGWAWGNNYLAESIGWAMEQQPVSALVFPDVYAAVQAGTDCTTAVEVARTATMAAGRRRLFFPAHPNGYIFNGAEGSDDYANGLLLPFTQINHDPASTIVIEGEGGTVFKCGSDDMVLLRISRNNVIVRDITLDCNGHTNVILCGVVPESMTQTTTQVSQSFVTLENVSRVGGPGVEGIVFQPGPQVDGSDSGCFYHRVECGSTNFIGGGRHVWCKASSTPLDANRITRSQFISQRLTRGNTGYQLDCGSEIDFIACSEELINSGTSPNATPTARIIDGQCHNINFYGGYSEACTKSFTGFARGVRSWGYTPASGSDTDFRTFVESWADNVDGSRPWAPVLAGTGGAIGTNNSTARNNKQGFVHNGCIQLDYEKGTVTGDLLLTGLPLVANSADWGLQGLVVVKWTGITFPANAVALGGRMVGGATIQLGFSFGNGTGFVPLNATHLSSSFTMTIQYVLQQ